MRPFRWFAIAAVAVCCCVSIARAQDPSIEYGLKSYGSFEGGKIDNINLLNQSLNLHIPLVSYPQKGGKLNISFSVVYLQPNLTYVLDHCTNPNDDRTCNQDWFYGGFLGGSGVQIALDGFPNVSNPPPLASGTEVTSIVTPDGASHYIGSPQTASGSARTGDISDYLLAWGGTITCGSSPLPQTNLAITDKSGNKYSYNSCNGLSGISDTNGNTITPNYATQNTETFMTSLTDTLSRTIPLFSIPPYVNTLTSQTSDFTGCTGSLPTQRAYLWNLPAPNGGTDTYKVCIGLITINLEGCQNATGNTTKRCIFEPGGAAIQSIVLPDGTAWTFGYDSSNSPSQFAYGDLTSITFPTGGTITYVWEGSPWDGGCVNSAIQFMRQGVQTRTLNANDGQGPQTTTYSQSFGSGSPTPAIMTVVDPLGNETIHTLTGLGNTCNYYETQTQYYQGTQSLLKQVDTAYQFDSSASAGGYLFSVVPTSVTTTWANGQVSQVRKSYSNDGSNNYTFGNVTSESDYDFGSGSPGALLRKTVSTYLYQSSSSFLTANVLTLPASVQVQDGGGTQRAYTTYSYDENNGSPQGTHGNQTSIHRWLNTTGGYLVTSNVYNSSGLVTSTLDPKNNRTSYGYSSSCPANSGYAGSGPTSEANALNQTTSICYDLNTGSLTSTTDPNNRTTSYTYDNMMRNTQISYPDGGLTTFSYPAPNEVTITESINSSASRLSYLLVDGVGRQIREAVTNGESTPYDEADTCYDALGLVSFKSYPFQDSGPFATTRSCGSPEVGDSFAFDALDRATSVTRSDGSTLLTSYAGRAASVQDEGDGTQSVQRISQVDGLGRLASVCEVTSTTLTVGISGSTAPAACGQDIAATGFLTTYAYDALDNLASVTQGPLATRSFVYDSLSRLTSATNPESSTTTYTYDADGNLATKTDARGTAITYAYDALNRLTGKTYSDSTPAVTYSYDQTSALGVTLTNTIGRKSSESTAGSNPTGSVFSYDPMGRVVNNSQCTPQNCSGTPFSLADTYDLLGDITSSTNGAGVALTNSYNLGARLTSVTSTLSDANHPAALLSGVSYGPFGRRSSTLGNGVTESLSYAPRGWLQAMTVTGNTAITSAAGMGTATISGSEQSAGGSPAAAGTGSATVSGSEQVTTNSSLAIDTHWVAQSFASGTTISTSFATHAANELLLAFVAGSGSGVTVTGVTGAGLTWQLVQRTNTQSGTAEVWRAFSSISLSSVTVAATFSSSNSGRFISVYGIKGADQRGQNGSGAIGAAASGSASSGGPTASLVTTRNNSWVFGIGDDPTNSTGRSVGSGQTLADQTGNGSNLELWDQRETSVTASSGTTVTLSDTSPTGDPYNFTAVEVLAAPVSYDTGTVSITVNGVQASASYGQSSTASSVASALAGVASSSGLPVTVSTSGGTLTLTANTTGSATNYSLSATSATNQSGTFSKPSFSIAVSGSALTGGVNAVPTSYDAGTVSITVNGIQASASYGQGSTPATVTSALTTAISSAGLPVTVSISGTTLSLTANTTGSATNYSLSATSSTSQPGTFSHPSFSVGVSGPALSGGQNAGPPPGGTIYSFSLGYAPDGDVASANDRVNGNWTYAYDPFNRLATSSVNGGATAYSYSYDRFGNRWSQTVTAGTGPSSNLGFDANNRIVSGSGVSYDAAGNTTNDGTTTYTYDAEDRITTAVNSSSGTSTYLYGAEGRRIRKTTGGATVDYVYDLAGHQIAEINSSGTWNRAEVYAGGWHLATYSGGGGGTTFFNHADWLGTERARSNISGAPCETVTNLPFGDGQATSGSCGDPSPMHFTGKERDSESNLDNFGARYDTSSMGRFMSPDPGSAGAEKWDTQSWNMYAYGRNNPLLYTDPSGEKYQICTVSDTGVETCVTVSDDQFDQAKKDPGSGIVLHNGIIYATGADGSLVKAGTYTQTDVDLNPFAVGALGGAYQRSGRALGYINTAFDAFFLFVAPATVGEAAPELLAAGFGRDAAEVANVLEKAAGVVGEQDMTVTSEKAAQEAADKFLGPGKQPIKQLYGNRAGQDVGWKSADGQRIVRVDTNAADPHYNFVNKTTGGNLHVYF